MRGKMQAHPYTTDYAGFSLVEVLVALAVVSIITIALVFAFNFGRPRAETLIHFSNKVYNAIQRYEIDTGCVPLVLTALISKVNASHAWSNSCHANVSARWDGPYLENTSSLRAALGPGGWIGMSVGLGPRPWLSLVFYTQKSIALQAKRMSRNRFSTFGCGGSGLSLCYLWIVYQ
jgi:prepilin-type N-terminal cleavage/methylation domain-containing protein